MSTELRVQVGDNGALAALVAVGLLAAGSWMGAGGSRQGPLHDKRELLVEKILNASGLVPGRERRRMKMRLMSKHPEVLAEVLQTLIAEIAA